jgi:hypothetical protein
MLDSKHLKFRGRTYFIFYKKMVSVLGRGWQAVLDREPSTHYITKS